MMENTEIVRKKDFIELKFTGYSNGNIFDSNIPEDLKSLSPDAKPEKTIVIVGENMIVPGFDKALEGKELNKEYEIEIPYLDGFGQRRRELVKTIPLNVFRSQNINPKPGAALLLDNQFARVITISGARVITDFNNPLSGKDLKYKFIITRKVIDLNEKSEAFFQFFLRFKPDFEISETAVFVKGPQIFEQMINLQKEKFKDLIGKDLEFKLEEKRSAQESNNESPENTPK
ncbi:MAG: FKBP-type peptidyl-prolyl cis-trans isomerase [Candidatus Pacearchaeota archaeon]|nr:FKBP-type peptidyl-prolyl cis-trans isomerase [Candidatus Pacearchaeota archaeon]